MPRRRGRARGGPARPPQLAGTFRGGVFHPHDDARGRGPAALVRVVEPADAPAIRRIYAEAFALPAVALGYRPSPMDRDYAALVENHFALALELEGRMVGAAVFQPRPEHFYVEAFAVTPSAQRQGLGGRLMSALEALAGELCFNWVRLHTCPMLHGAMRFYAAQGYAERRRSGVGTAARVEFEKRVDNQLTRLLEV